LKFLILSPINTKVINKSTRVSFQTYKNPVPFIIMFLIIIIKYLGGSTALIQSYIFGIFSIGKIKPESNIVGSIMPTSEINIACCIVEEIVDIRIPSERLMRI
jgi:hypothetical protein